MVRTCPVVRTLHFYHRGTGSIPDPGTKIPHALQLNQKGKKKKVEFKASLVAQVVKNPPAMQETPVLFLDWEDVLEKGLATHSSILAWKIPWTV